MVVPIKVSIIHRYHYMLFLTESSHLVVVPKCTVMVKYGVIKNTRSLTACTNFYCHRNLWNVVMSWKYLHIKYRAQLQYTKWPQSEVIWQASNQFQLHNLFLMTCQKLGTSYVVHNNIKSYKHHKALCGAYKLLVI